MRANASRVDRSRASGNGNAASATAVSTAATAALETATLETAAAARADAEIGRLDERGVGGGVGRRAPVEVGDLDEDGDPGQFPCPGNGSEGTQLRADAGPDLIAPGGAGDRGVGLFVPRQ